VVAPAAAFFCEVCGKPLGRRRVRQGVLSHPGCRRALAPDAVAEALDLARGTLERLGSRAPDGELRELFSRATAQAQALIGDLNRLKSFVGGTGRDDAR
jgi:hypothetical protein